MDIQQTKVNYTVKRIETVVVGTDVQARIFTLAPGDLIPWHSHTESTDHYFVLTGALSVETRVPDDRRTLGIGEHYRIAAGIAHLIANRGAMDCRFLLLQGVGKYDWIKAEG